MAKDKVIETHKFEITYSDEDCDQIWKYDLKKYANGPISVETKWKSHILKTWSDAKKLKSVRVTSKNKK